MASPSTPTSTDENAEILLLKLRYKHGQGTKALIEASSRNPVMLDDSRMVWVVYTGNVDVFAVTTHNGEIAGPRHYLFQCEAGQLLFGFNNALGISLMAVGGPDTKLLRLERSEVSQLSKDQVEPEAISQIAPLLNQWVISLSAGLATENPPRESMLLEAGKPITLSNGQIARVREILWVRHIEGNSHFLGNKNLPLMGIKSIPVTSRTWFEASDSCRVDASDTSTFIQQENEWDVLNTFHHLALQCIRHRVGMFAHSERQRLIAKAEADQHFVSNAFRRLTSVLDSEPSATLSTTAFTRPNPILVACQTVGKAQGIEIIAPPPLPTDSKKRNIDPLFAIARASRIRYRKVALRGEWWHSDCGPLIVFRGSPNKKEIAWERAVALIPTTTRDYELHLPYENKPVRVTFEIAADLEPFGYMLYRSLPECPLTLWDLLRFGLRGSRADLWMVLLMGIIAGLLGTLTPIVTGIIFDSAIPSSDQMLLYQLGLALFSGALGILMFQVTRNIAILRVEGKLGSALQAAMWDRLLRLPPTFFRGYSAGDLTERVNGVDDIRKTIFGNTLSALLSSIFSIFSFFLLFVYNNRLAWIVAGLVLVSVLATGLIGYVQIRHQRQVVTLHGELSGMVLQFLNSIAKFRVAGVEGWAFTRWAKKFSQQKRAAIQARTTANILAVFNATYPILTTMMIFGAMAWVSQQDRLSTGAFLGFFTAFTQFLAGSLAVSSAVISALNIIPMYERAYPILQALPETDVLKADPGELTGRIEVSQVVFRYREDEPPVLHDISMQIEPGQFVALVGPSGSGKSSLLRLLLGFEAPSAGAVYYDGQDITGLDIVSVRRQMGVVLQDGKLFAGDIFSNIIGSLPLTLEDAWEAAQMVGMDEDIRHMPMGMNTVISEGGSNLSGGQRQRILIARAIINRPRILFFDEATSALDNQTQAIVSNSLERLRATRVVIAHRLSTILHADRIFVISGGSLVQSGTYQSLMEQGGLFADLAKRQLT